MLEKVGQIIKFSIVGIINTVVSLFIYYLLLGLSVHYNMATVCGYIGSSIIGYILNKVWVFQAKKISSKRSLFRYYVVYGTALLLNLFFMHVWIQIFGIDKRIAPILTLCITIPYNFILSKFWVFQVQRKGKNNYEKEDRKLFY